MQRKIRYCCCKTGFSHKCTLMAKATQSSMMSKLSELSHEFHGDPGSGNGCHSSDLDNEQNEQRGSGVTTRLLRTKSQQTLILEWRQENDGRSRAGRTTKHKNWVETSSEERGRHGKHPYVAQDSCFTMETAKGRRMNPCFMILFRLLKSKQRQICKHFKDLFIFLCLCVSMWGCACAHGVPAEARRGRKKLWSKSYNCECLM